MFYGKLSYYLYSDFPTLSTFQVATTSPSYYVSFTEKDPTALQFDTDS